MRPIRIDCKGKYIDYLHDLRWRFDFADRCVVPDWGDHREGHAEGIDKTGMVSAAIEARNRKTGNVKIITICPRWEFKEFRTLVLAGIPAFGLRGHTVQISPSFHGIELHTTDGRVVTAYIDGRLELTRPNKEVANA